MYIHQSLLGITQLEYQVIPNQKNKAYSNSMKFC